MKKILFVALMACVVVGCSKSTSDQTPNSLQQSGLNGPVKSVDMRTYEATTYFGDVKKGDLISNKDIMSFNFTLCAGVRTDYNKEGKAVQYTLRDEKGQILQMQKKEYFQNHLVGEKFYDEKGDPMYTWRYEIKNDKPVSQIVTYYFPGAFDSSQKSIMSDTLECTFDGFLLKTAISRINGKIISTSENTYENGLVVSTVRYESENRATHTEWNRNDAGMVMQYKMYDDDHVVMDEDMTYDERGFLTRYINRESIFTDKKDLTLEYLSVDDYGNWTRRVVNKDQMPLYLQERTILYYDDQPEQKGRPERKKR